MRWLYIHCPHLSLEQQLRYRADQTQPCVLTDAGGKQVLLTNTHAADQGIHIGMGLNTANALAPDLVILEDEPEQTQAALAQLAALVYRQVANVSLQPPTGLLLEIGSMRRLIDSEATLQDNIVRIIQEQGYQALACRGHTPLMAELLAVAGGQPGDSNADRLDSALAELPLSQCGLPERTLASLSRLGIRSCRDLLALPTASLGRRFGRDLLHWRERLLGHLEDPQTWYLPAQRFYRHLDLQSDIEHTRGLVFPLSRVFHEFAHYCHQTQQATDQIRLRLHHRERPPTLLDLGSAVPQTEAEDWLSLLRLRLERLTLFAPVTELDVKIQRLMPLSTECDDWVSQPQQRTDPAALLSRLQARLGNQVVHGLTQQADHRPEFRNQEMLISSSQSVDHRPQATRRPTSGAEQNSTALSTTSNHRPFWLLSEPQAVARTQLELLTGPERIQTGWWDLNGVKRDYYRARLSDNSLCWVYERPDAHWFIAGYFG